MRTTLRDIKGRLRTLLAGVDANDKTSVTKIALQLRAQRYNPREIVKAVKAETGIGLSLRIFKIDDKAAGTFALAVKASKVVGRRVEHEVVSEARDRIEKVLSVGKAVLDQISLLARFHGYPDVEEFVWMLYNFWDLNHDYVPKLEEDLKLHEVAIRELYRIASPEAKRILLANKMSEFMQLITALAMLDGRFPPQWWYFEIRTILASILYDELKLETCPGKVN